eukprot:1126354-Pelagomonas_calceolata.AAC.6
MGGLWPCCKSSREHALVCLLLPSHLIVFAAVFTLNAGAGTKTLCSSVNTGLLASALQLSRALERRHRGTRKKAATDQKTLHFHLQLSLASARAPALYYSLVLTLKESCDRRN